MAFGDGHDIGDLKQFMLDVLEHGEPNHVTHQMSIWNRARRFLTLLETGERISEAMSWNAEKNEWIL